MEYKKTLVSSALSLMLLGCGGGEESSSTKTDLASIDSSNTIKMVKVVVPLAIGFDEPIDLAESIVPREVVSPDPLAIATKAALSRLGGAAPRNIALTNEEQCAFSGSETISADISDPETLTAGDVINLSFDACANSYDEEIDGQITMIIKNFTGDINDSATILDVEMRFDNLTVTSSTDTSIMHGDIRVASDMLNEMVDIIISGDSFTTSSMGNTQSIKNFLSTYTEDSSQFPIALTLSGKGTVVNSEFAGAVNYKTPVIFSAWGDNYPYAGELLITGANNATLHLITLSDIDIQIDADYNGDAIVDETFYMLWSELEE
jgi:hypothetical protein